MNPTKTQTERPKRLPAVSETAVGRFRWVILGVLFGATTINYMDRVLLFEQQQRTLPQAGDNGRHGLAALEQELHGGTLETFVVSFVFAQLVVFSVQGACV
jgi:hypothetical protein